MDEDYNSLSREELLHILDEDSIDLARRMKAREALTRLDRKKPEKPKWGWQPTIGFAALFLTVVGWFITPWIKQHFFPDRAAPLVSSVAATKPTLPRQTVVMLPPETTSTTDSAIAAPHHATPHLPPSRAVSMAGNINQGPSSVSQIGNGNTLTVNNPVHDGDEPLLVAQADAISLINQFAPAVADAFSHIQLYREMPSLQKFPEVVTWHVGGIRKGFDLKYRSELHQKLLKARDELMGQITSVPPPPVANRDLIYSTPAEGIEVIPENGEAKLYDLCILLEEMQREHNLPITFPANSIRDRVHPPAQFPAH